MPLSAGETSFITPTRAVSTVTKVAATTRGIHSPLPAVMAVRMCERHEIPLVFQRNLFSLTYKSRKNRTRAYYYNIFAPALLCFIFN